MKVSRTAFYAYRRGATYRGTSAQMVCREKVRNCFFFHRRRYGTRRIAAELKIGRGAVRTALTAENLRAIQPRSFKPKTTDSRHGLPVCANLLQIAANAPRDCGEVFIGDITYLPLKDGGFCYLACLQDKFTRRIVSWKVADRMTAQLVIDVFLQARRRGLIGKNAIIHTDQGSQYAAVEYRRLLYVGGFRQSMSRRGNCYDNAQAESFFSRFKAELVENGIFETVEDARSEIFSYIEGYYNRIRLHSGLGYKSPLEFEKELKINQRSESSVC